MRNTGIEYPAQGQMNFCDLGDPPDPGPTEILIETRYSGITNGTERHALMGEHVWGQYPSRHGYQHVGQVAAAGSQVQDFAIGDWIFFGRYVGHRGWHVQDVSFADPRTNGSHLCLKLPEDIDHRYCALFGVAGVAMRGIRRFRVSPAQNVWVAGAGLIGQFAAQAARVSGAHVTVTDVNPKRLDIASQVGAHRTLDAGNENTISALQETGPYDVIVDACGLSSFLLDIHRDGLLAHGGVVGCLAVHTETTFHWSMLHSREASIEVSCHFALDDLRVLLHFFRQGEIQVDPLVTHIAPIDQAPEIYAMLRDRPGEPLGILFDWSI